MVKNIDRIDARILRLLNANGRIPNTEISKRTGIAEATVRYRIQRLVREGYIQIVAVADPLKLGFEFAGCLKIAVDSQYIAEVGRRLETMDELWYVARVLGAADFMAAYNARSSRTQQELIEKIRSLEGVQAVAQSTVVERIKDGYNWGANMP
jgi:Lrp/AsnC family transcriptional regulator, regulator for asnA, asnC and gidA